MAIGEIDRKAYRRAQHAQILERRIRVMNLYFERRSQAQIANELGISQQQVSEDIKAAIAHYKRLYDIDAMALIVQEVERLNRLEGKAWEAYELSRQDKKVATVNSSLGGVTTTATVVERKEGDVAFLKVILDCIGMRIKLLRLAEREVKDEQEKQMPTFSEFMAHWWKKRDAAEKLPKIRPPRQPPRGLGFLLPLSSFAYLFHGNTPVVLPSNHWFGVLPDSPRVPVSRSGC
jgi:predicted transcriptional regulator